MTHAYDCGCTVVMCDCGDPDTCNAPWRIEYCPLHKASPELLKVCKLLLKQCEHYLGPTLCGGDMTKARAAIAAAEGSI